MSEILRFLIDYASFLYAPGRYRFVDSGASASFGGDAFLILASDALRIRLVSDRGQLFADFQGTGQDGDLDWYSIDVCGARSPVSVQPRPSCRPSTRTSSSGIWTRSRGASRRRGRAPSKR